MKCMYCNGPLERSRVPYHIDREHVHVIIDEVPAWVCTQCGEAMFDEEAVDEIQQLVTAVDQRTERLAGIA
ncbi:MAG: type II toxin-antitoxin system MqsA family antitoxin [Spirochaetaceae bacterium]|nr:MAG: type II toxin-antitoxin system MqsA family antitoxin [Spirochaetaceae bacterium]